MKNKTLAVIVLLVLLCAGRFWGSHDDGNGQASQGVGASASSESSMSRDSSSGDLLEQKGREGRMLYREGYVVCFDEASKIPYWVAWHLTAEHVDGDVRRSDDFAEDPEVADGPTLADYRGSGWSRGHMCPAGDNRWSRQAMSQSFLLTNMCPQNARLNNGDWKELEEKCRKWAKRYGDIYIVCGPLLYNRRHQTIGKGQVVVPEAFFKVVLCMSEKPKALGFIYKNEDGNRPMGDYVNTIDEVERITGLDFFPALDDDVERAVESKGDIKDWM